jgi:15-cis-phytoene desaturase
MHAVIAGAGPAGMACAKWLTDRGYTVTVLEKRAVPGGKVSAWQDADGDWIESGLHVFFGAYHTLLGFLDECGLDDAFHWKPAEMIFATRDRGFAPITFVEGLPAPLNGLAGVTITKLMTPAEKLRMALGLLQPIFRNQSYIDAQDEQSYSAWHLRHGMGERSLREIMDTMALALSFRTADKISAKLVLTALLHFAQEKGASRMAFVKGSPQTRIWAPLTKLLEGRGSTLRTDARVREIVYDPSAGRVAGFALEDGSLVTGDVYISAMPVHSLRKVLPAALRELEYFDNLKHLRGQPVITVQLFFDRQVTGVDHLLFSARTHMSVYADMVNVAPDYQHERGEHSMVQFVIAPAEELIAKSDEEIVALVTREFYELHPSARAATIRKSSVVRIPQSVYQARPGVDRYRPDQASPVPNLFLCGDYTQQPMMACIEGAIISAKQAVERIERRSVRSDEPQMASGPVAARGLVTNDA